MVTAGEKQHEPLDEHVRGGETLPAGPSGKRDYLTAPVVAALSLMTVFLLARIAGRVLYPFPLDTGEGTFLSSAWYASKGENVYGFAKAPPYVFTIYNPLMLYLTAAVFRVFGSAPTAARLFSSVFYFGAAYVAYRFVRRETGMKWAGVVAALFLLVERHFVSRAAFVVADYPAIFFSLLGLNLWRGKGSRRYAAVISFALAFLSKQTSLMAAAAAFLSLFLEGKRAESIRLFGVFLAVLGVAAVIAGALFGAAFFVDTLYYAAIAPFDTGQAARSVGITAALYLALLAGWIVMIKDAFRDRRLLLPVLYVLFGFLLACTSGKVGASRSYLFDFAAGLAIVAGLLWGRVCSRLLTGATALPIVGIVAVQVLLVGVGTSYGMPLSGGITKSDFLRDSAIKATHLNHTGLIYCREPGFDVGTPARTFGNDICKLNQLMDEGAFPQEAFVRPGRDLTYSVIVIPDKQRRRTLMTDTSAEEISPLYELETETAGLLFFVPRAARTGDK